MGEDDPPLPPQGHYLYRIFKKSHPAMNSYMTDHITVHFGIPRIPGIIHQSDSQSPTSSLSTKF